MREPRFVAILLAMLSAYVLAQHARSDVTRFSGPHYQAYLPPGTSSYPFRYWDRQFLITYSIDDTGPKRPAAILYDRSGRIAREVYVSFKDAYSTSIGDVAVSKSGQIVVAGGTESRAGAIANFIASIGGDGRMRQVIRTTPFLPVYICSSVEGNVWSYGIDRDSEGRGVSSSLRLREYSFGKGQLRAMLDTSTLNSSGWTLERGRYPGEISLRCTSKKVGLFNGRSSEWIEFDLAANKLRAWRVAPLPSPREMQVTGLALTEDGQVFASLHDRSSNPPRSGLFVLSPDSNSAGLRTWVPVSDTIGPFLQGAKVWRLLGADGSDLVYARDVDGTAYWSRYAK
jgi:hypothetical protein